MVCGWGWGVGLWAGVGGQREERESECGTGASQSSISFAPKADDPDALSPSPMGRLKSSLSVAQAVHRLVRMGGMPEPRWLAAAER